MVSRQPVDQNQVLQEVLELYEAGDKSFAFEMLDDLLAHHPHADDIRLLKAELCVRDHRASAFVAEVAADLRQKKAKITPRERALLDNIRMWTQAALRSGRKRLADDEISDAMDDFQISSELAGDEVTTHLGIGLAIYDHLQAKPDAADKQGEQEETRQRPVPEEMLEFFPRRPGQSRPSQGLPGRRPGQSRSAESRPDRETPVRQPVDVMQAAFNAVRMHSVPESGQWLVATRHLAGLEASRGKFDEAEGLLVEAIAAGHQVDEEMKALQTRSASQALDEINQQIGLWLRTDQADKAAVLIEAALQAAPDHSQPWLMLVEWLWATEDLELASSVCRWMADHTFAQVIDGHVSDWLAEPRQNVIMPCPRCESPFETERDTCAVCDYRLEPWSRLIDLPGNEADIPYSVAALYGLARIAEAQGKYEQAAQALNRLHEGSIDLDPYHDTLDALEEHLTPLREEAAYAASLQEVTTLYSEGRYTDALAILTDISAQRTDDVPITYWLLCCSLQAQSQPEMIAHLLEQAAHVTQVQWSDLSIKERAALIDLLIGGGWLVEARRLMIRLFDSDELNKRDVQRANKRLIKAVAQQQQQLLDKVRIAFNHDQIEQVFALSDHILELDPDCLEARLLRGQAHLLSERPHMAGRDFEAVLAANPDQSLRVAAGLGLARVYAALRNLPGALQVLDSLPTNEFEVRALREIFEREQLLRPIVDVMSVGDGMFRAIFAIEVAAAARWQGSGLEKVSADAMLKAGHDFVSMLGGLADQPGNQIFELRTIITPDPVAPLHGKTQIALLCGIDHAIEDVAERLALELWDRLRPHLPLSGDYIYDYRPVYDVGVLALYLRPFEVRDGAVFARREMVEEGAYAIQPFTTGGTSLHRLLSMLLRRHVPAMISVRLSPTHLTAAEHTALTAHYDRLRRMKLPGSGDESRLQDGGIESNQRPDAFILPDEGMVSLIEMMGSLRNQLEMQAYHLQIAVASPELHDALLAPAVGAELFGPGGRFVTLPLPKGDQANIIGMFNRLDALNMKSTLAPKALSRLRHLAGAFEAAWLFRLPVPDEEGLPGLPSIDVKAVPPTQLPARGLVLGETVAALAGLHPVVRIQPIDRRRHQYVVGKTGVGKSTLLESMALQDIEAGRGVAVFDPHGDMVESLLTRIPASRMNDVVVFDPSDEARPVGINFLQAETDSQRHRIATEFIQMLMRMYDPGQTGIVGPRFQHNVRNAMMTVMLAHPGATLIELVRALTDKKYVQKLLPDINDPMVKRYWTDQISQTSDFHKSEILDYIVSKFNRFVGDKLVRNIVGQSESTLDFRDIMDRKKILLVNLSKGKIGPESAEFLGFLLLQSLLIAALSRADLSVDDRQDFCLYVDEFQTFATESFISMLSEGRKYGLCLVMANQYLSQLPQSILDAVLGNVGTLIAFQVGVQDAGLLSREFYPVFNAHDLINIPRYTAAARLLVDGLATRPFALHTRLTGNLPNAALANQIREISRMRYGREVTAVEQEIDIRLGFAT